MKIAAILTCFNRREKTLSCLKALLMAIEAHHARQEENISLSAFLTDDGCTDGTVEAVRQLMKGRNLRIIQGDGHLYWAGGMRAAWREAMAHDSHDYFLLLNDDTTIHPHCLTELFSAERYCETAFGQEGIVSGITCAPGDPMKITYGGDVIPNKFSGRSIRLGVSESPRMVDVTNANILLVPGSVVGTIGIFHDGFSHSRADNDYSMLARRKGIPVVITAGICGECENDHGDPEELRQKIISMTLAERKAYFRHPLHSTSDYLTFIRRNAPLRYPLSCLFSAMRTYLPRLYYIINGARGVS